MSLFEKVFNWFFMIEDNTIKITDKIVDEIKKEKQTESLNKKSIQTVVSGKRPLSFKDYVGQTKAKRLLKGYIQGVGKRGVQFPHLLIHGPAGCGKTTLANIIANELQCPFIEVVASEIESVEDLVELILDNEKALLFLDEIHGLKRNFVEPLYPLMEDFKYNGEQIAPFTIIGATTEIGEIIKNRKPFYDRFVLKQELEDYKPYHIQRIITNFNHKHFADVLLSENVLKLISQNSRNTPRIAISLLQSTIYLGGNIEATLNSNNIIWKGYTNTDLNALKIIARHNRGIGVQAIAAFLNTSADNYVFQIEPYLLKTHCIMRTSKGRIISDYGCKVIKHLESMK